MLARMSPGTPPTEDYAAFAELMEESSLYGVGAYFCDRHPELVDAVIEQSSQIEAAGLEGYARDSAMDFDQCLKTLLTGLAVRYYKAING